MADYKHYHTQTDPAQLERKKRYLGATIITCITLAMIFGALHVVKLGSNRMADMRNKATYDLAEESLHVSAAGEDIFLHAIHEKTEKAEQTYETGEVNSLLTKEQWLELDRMALVPAGSFVMGTNNKRSDAQNKPKHSVSLPAYYIDKYPVTNAQYAQFIVATKHRPPLDWKNGKIPEHKLLHPVTMVSWYDARDFCAWADKRLPSEAEWEKAARGVDGRRWPWGNTMDPKKLNTYYNIGSTTEVMFYANGVSPYGVFDMAGNVSEWTASDFESYEGSTAPAALFEGKVAVAKDPKDRAMKVVDLVPVEAKYKVRRGGSWKSDPFSTSSYHRNFSFPFYASDFFGFRCAKSENSGASQ
jgi:iron(II)-dependent oxidoreductase